MNVCRRFYKKLEYGPCVRCDQCGTASTSQWHRDRRGQTSCSACYHYTRRHGQPRPTDKRWVWVIELEYSGNKPSRSFTITEKSLY